MPQVVQGMRRGNTREFPRIGVWSVVGNRLGVIFDLSKDKEKAEVHFVDKEGETDEIVKDVPVNKIRQAKHGEFSHLTRCSHQTPFESAKLGYELTEKDRKSLTPYQRKQVGLLFDDADAAEAEVEESSVTLKEKQERAKWAKLSAHPEVIALEDQIEKDRVAFIKEVEKKRAALAKKVLGEK